MAIVRREARADETREAVLRGLSAHNAAVATSTTPAVAARISAGKRLVATASARTPWLYQGDGGELSEIDLGPTGAEVRVVGDPGPLRFAGQRADRETGLRYNHHRYY